MAVQITVTVLDDERVQCVGFDVQWRRGADVTMREQEIGGALLTVINRITQDERILNECLRVIGKEK